MSLSIIKTGILDTIQDRGRFGHQHSGINPNGAMDPYSAQLANALLGKELNAPVLELHYPACHIKFNEPAIICITGADFSAAVNDRKVPHNYPLLIEKDAVLNFKGRVKGYRCYISFLPELSLELWMGSFSTNTVCNAGGYKGRSLKKGDVLPLTSKLKSSIFNSVKDFSVVHWTAGKPVRIVNEISFIIGSEWFWLSKEAQTEFREKFFQITNEADRMGYRLAASPLETVNEESLISSGVSFGTIQLLPNGQLIILMADHQTTGGYPRIANVISTDLSVLAQKGPNDIIRFILTDLKSAESSLKEQQRTLRQIQLACNYNMEILLHGKL